ncbi:MAG: MerR family transcriptional regulator [bacterium]|nr:MerR family transcriptional regulator [bacterium]
MDQEKLSEESPTEVDGYRAPQVCKLVGITYRQLDYWDRTGLLRPSLKKAEGSGTQRLYTFSDVVQLRVIKRLLDTGLDLRKVRITVDWLRENVHIDQPLWETSLLSDGSNLWISLDDEDTQEFLMDALSRGQGVFAITVGKIQRDLEGELLEFAKKAVQAPLPLAEDLSQEPFEVFR